MKTSNQTLALAALTVTRISGFAKVMFIPWNQTQRMKSFLGWHQNSMCWISNISTATAAVLERIPEQAINGQSPSCSNAHVYSCNSTIASLTKSGRMEEARQLFDKMPNQDIFSWTSMVAGYARKGNLNAAREFFDRMPERNVVSWTSMVSGYARNGKIEEARHLFDKMPERNVFSWTAMVTGYAQNGKLKEARRVFDEMPERNVVSWTAMVAGYTQNGRIEDARSLFDKMPERDVVSWTLMIKGYMQNGRVEDAQQLFDQMPEKNLYSWNTMIAGYVQNQHVDRARQLFDTIPKRNAISWTAMVVGYAQIGNTEEARRLFDKMPQRDIISWNAIVTAYAQNGKLKEARELFDNMPQRDVVSWNAVLAGYEQNGEGEDALKLFNQMLRSGTKPDQSTFTSILSACTSLAAIEQGKQIHKHIIKTIFNSDVSLGNALIGMYAKCGSIDDALQVFDKMLIRDKVSWTTAIVGYSRHGYSNEALELFRQMEKAGVKPDHVTFVGVLSACSHAGLVAEGWHFFDSMSRDYSITPMVEHYSCMADLLGRCGHLHEAEEMIRKMPFQPDAVIWGALLSACRVHSNVDLGRHVAEKLFELEPENGANYVLLSNIYAAARRWDDVAAVRVKMKDKGVKKQPGCSWIEVKDKIHTFLVGDQSHPQTEKIYATLEALAEPMKALGYFPDTNFALHDVAEEEKEQLLCHHSEKLAIAFGLISTPPGTPIRIVKNLRVCGDCHTAAKFISKIAMREIVLRDANRFHHIKDGFCSCRDYW